MNVPFLGTYEWSRVASYSHLRDIWDRLWFACDSALRENIEKKFILALRLSTSL